LKIIAKDLTLPDLVVRSNKRGWKFNRIDISNIASSQKLTDMETAAKNAVKSIGLDFGAVDCAIDEEGEVQVIEVNTGPGLQGSTFNAYMVAIKEYLTQIVEEEQDTETQRRARIENEIVTQLNAQTVREEMNTIMEGIRNLNDKMANLIQRNG